MRRRILAVASAAAVAATGLLLGVRPAHALVTQFDPHTGTPTLSDRPQAYAGATVAQVLGNGRNQIVAGYPDGYLAVYDPAGGTGPVWARQFGAIEAAPTVSDLNSDGHLDVVVATGDGLVVALDGASGQTLWVQHATPPNSSFSSAFEDTVAVGDMFGDGRKEVVVGGLDIYVHAFFGADGSIVPGWPQRVMDDVVDTAVLVDLEHNGRLDVVVGADDSSRNLGPYPHNGAIYYAFRPDGSLINGWPVFTDQTAWASPTADSLKLNGVVDIVAGTGDNYPEPAGHAVYAFTQTGGNEGGWPVGTGDRNFASPAVGDIRGNGGREVVEVSENGKLYAWDGFGGLLAGFPVDLTAGSPSALATAGRVSPIIAPVDGTGINGIWTTALVPAPNAGVNNAVEGIDSSGAVKQTFLLPGNGWNTAPLTVAPLGDGGLSVVSVNYANQATNPGAKAQATWQVNTFAIKGTGTSMPANSWPTFHGNIAHTGSNLPRSPAPPPPPHGYWLVATDGGIFPFGNAPGFGSTGGMHLNKPIVGMAALPDGTGYWLVASDGGIFPFGRAGGYGSTGGIHLNQPIVAMAVTKDGQGYWLVASDGGIFPFGDARGYGSTGNIRLNKPIVGIATTGGGGGYWLVASDGGIFPFGDAQGYGSTGGIHLNQPIVGMASTSDGGGYWLVASDGGIFPFGNAPGYGSTGGIHLNKPIVAMSRDFDGRGYYLVASDGGIFPFPTDGSVPGYGSTGGIHLNQPITAMAVTP